MQASPARQLFNSRKQFRAFQSVRRRGSIYILTLSTALIVSVLALAAMTRVRIQRRQSEDVSSSVQAQLHAEAGIQMALYHMRNTANWRTLLHNGAGASDKPIGDGFYNFVGTDPTDSNLTDSDYDPVEIIATGKSGDAVHKLKVLIEVTQPGLNCLASAMHAGNNLEFDKVTATIGDVVSADHDAKSKNNSVVNANVEANNNIQEQSGGVFNGTKTAGTPTRQMPTSATVVSGYTTNGTTIPYGSIPEWTQISLANPGAESGTSNWNTYNCDVDLKDDPVHGGSNSFEVKNRDNAGATIYQVVTPLLTSGNTYHLHAEVWVDSGKEDDFRVGMDVNTSNGSTYFETPWKEADGDKWTTVHADVTVNWTGTLNYITFYVRSQNHDYDFFLDDMKLEDKDVPPDTRKIHGELLSPASNPFGSTNSLGIYVIDCGGDNISIKDSRIVGTLVLKNFGNETKIHGSVNWEPTQISADPNTPNYACLIAEGDIDINLSSADLSEASVGASLNPSGTPYNGSSDSDQSDTYPSHIAGLVYSTHNIAIRNNSVFVGPVVADNDLKFIGESAATDTLNVEGFPLYYEVNAPPGFKADPVYSISIDGYSQVVD